MKSVNATFGSLIINITLKTKNYLPCLLVLGWRDYLCTYAHTSIAIPVYVYYDILCVYIHIYNEIYK